MDQASTRRQKRRGRLAIVTVVGAMLVLTACFPAVPQPSRQSSDPVQRMTAELIDQVNHERAARGLPSLRWEPYLTGMAQDWSQYLADTGKFEHRDLSAAIRLPPFNISMSALGENILRGPGSVSTGAMTRAWMQSSGHRANILSPGFDSVGIGVVCQNGSVYVTQNFGRDAGSTTPLGGTPSQQPIVSSSSEGGSCR